MLSYGYLVLLAALLSSAFALPTIQAKGSKFFTSDGNQWYIKGIAYQRTSDDPLVDGDQCQLDASLMKTLGANAIRVYHVDATADHDACMSAFEDAGIYVFPDLDTFDTYILPEANKPRWNKTQLDRYAEVMDAFHTYDNLAGFFVGNEMLNTAADSIAAPYVKASARDMKAYRDSRGYRKIPIGYSATDSGSLRPNLQNYLACGSNASESLDFFSLNAYEWCGPATYEISGYEFLQKNASEYNIPIFFSETGCNTVKPRTFADQSAILGRQMMDTWSGAIIYEWIEEQNGYGLISYGPKAGDTATGVNIVDGFTRAGAPTPVSPDFENLKSQWATLTPTGVLAADYSPSLSPPACPRSTAGSWDVDGGAPLPAVGEVFSSRPQNQATSTITSVNSHSATRQTGSSVSDASPSASETKSSSASMGKREMAESKPCRLLIQMGVGLAAMAVIAGLM